NSRRQRYRAVKRDPIRNSAAFPSGSFDNLSAFHYQRYRRRKADICRAIINLFGRLFASFQLRFFIQDRVQQRTMHLDLSVVADKSQLAKLVQEKARPGSSRSDHLRQGCLIDRSIDWRWLSTFSEIGQQKKKAREPFLARIE